MLVILGYLIVLLSVFGGFAMAGGHLLALFQPIELLMIGGAALGSFIVSNNFKIVILTIKSVFSIIFNFGYSKKYYVQLLSFLFEIVYKVKKQGALSVEADIENINESAIAKKYPLVLKDKEIIEFFIDHMRLIITGRVNNHQLESLIEQDIETFQEEKEQCANAINKVADSLPAFGIVAAVMGVVHTMESLGIPPEQLGALIAKALVGTFLGVLIGYGFIAPLAYLIGHRTEAAVKSLNCIRVVLIAMMNQFSPSIALEFGRKIIYSKERPNGKELEELLKGISQSNVGSVE